MGGARGSQLPEQAPPPSAGSFLLVYLLLLLLVGIPLLYMEMIIGEWLCVDNIRAWKQLVPWLSGLGYSSVLVGGGWQPASSRCLVSFALPLRPTLFSPGLCLGELVQQCPDLLEPHLPWPVLCLSSTVDILPRGGKRQSDW